MARHERRAGERQKHRFRKGLWTLVENTLKVGRSVRNQAKANRLQQWQQQGRQSGGKCCLNSNTNGGLNSSISGIN